MRDHNDAKTKFDGYENKDILIDIKNDLITSLLQILLKDKSTKRNIIWATDTYSELGIGFKDKDQINRDLLLNHADIIKPRIRNHWKHKQTGLGKRQRFLLLHGFAI